MENYATKPLQCMLPGQQNMCRYADLTSAEEAKVWYEAHGCFVSGIKPIACDQYVMYVTPEYQNVYA